MLFLFQFIEYFFKFWLCHRWTQFFVGNLFFSLQFFKPFWITVQLFNILLPSICYFSIFYNFFSFFWFNNSTFYFGASKKLSNKVVRLFSIFSIKLFLSPDFVIVARQESFVLPFNFTRSKNVYIQSFHFCLYVFKFAHTPNDLTFHVAILLTFFFVITLPFLLTYSSLMILSDAVPSRRYDWETILFPENLVPDGFIIILWLLQCTCAILSPVAWPSLNYFSTLSHKRHDFLKRKVTEHKMCVLISSTTFAWDIFHSKNNWVRYD